MEICWLPSGVGKCILKICTWKAQNPSRVTFVKRFSRPKILFLTTSLCIIKIWKAWNKLSQRFSTHKVCSILDLFASCLSCWGTSAFHLLYCESVICFRDWFCVNHMHLRLVTYCTVGQPYVLEHDTVLIICTSTMVWFGKTNNKIKKFDLSEANWSYSFHRIHIRLVPWRDMWVSLFFRMMPMERGVEIISKSRIWYSIGNFVEINLKSRTWCPRER